MGRITRWLAYLAVSGLVGLLAGRPWTFVCIFALPTIGAVFHVIWRRRHGVNPLTAEPRDRYEQLRRSPRSAADTDSTDYAL